MAAAEAAGARPPWLTGLEPVAGRFRVRAERPRLYLTAADLPTAAARVASSHRDAWERIEAARGSQGLTDRMLANAFSYLVTGNRAQAREAIEAALEQSADHSSHDLANAYRVWPEAVAYDWCRDRVSAAAGRRLLANVQVQLEMAGGPSLETQTLHMGHLVNHLADAHLPAGIAFHEEAPGIYARALGVARSQIAAKNLFYRHGLSSQGNSYGVTHFNGDIRLLAMLRAATGEDLLQRFPFYRDVGYYWIYTRRPDGQLLRNGDDYLDASRSGSYWSPAWLAEALAWAADAYRDPYLLGEYLKVRNLGQPWTAILDILRRDPTLEPKGPQDLPPVRYLDGPAGTLLWRSGWGPDDAVGLFKVGPLYVKNHEHLDRLSFQVYCRGALAIDSGLYEGRDSGYGSAHWIQYFQRTIAHNSLLIRDPAEVVLYRGQPVAADGGQRYPGQGHDPVSLDDLTDPMWRIARVLGCESDGEAGCWTVVTGDATQAYGAKAESVRRTFALLAGFGAQAGVPAAALVVHDRVVSRQPELEKVWLLHSLEEPSPFAGGFTVARSGPGCGGVLVAHTLLPRSPRLEVTGGPGRQFEVNGVDHPTAKGGDAEGGAWRVEVTAAGGGASVEFLHVLLVYPAQPGAMARVDAIDAGAAVGVELLDRTVVLAPPGQTLPAMEYSSRGIGERQHLLWGLPAGTTAEVTMDGQGVVRRAVGPAGALAFRVRQAGRVAAFGVVAR